jgi:hypothetical protein
MSYFPRSAIVVSALLVLVFTGCVVGESGHPLGGHDRVSAYVQSDELVVENFTTERIWTFAIGQKAGATVLWAPNLAGEGIEPGRRKGLALDEILMAPDEQEVLVYYWGAVVEDGEVVPGPVRSLRVPL